MKLKEPVLTLITKGHNSLDDQTLLTTAFHLSEDTANEILKIAKFELSNIAKLSFQDLIKIKNVSHNKAAAIISAFEIGRRRFIFNPAKSAYKITSSEDTYQYIKPFLVNQPIEFFYIIMLNRGNKVINHKLISQGGISATIVDIPLIFKYAIENLSSALILIHNHPSGNLRPSEHDKSITDKLVKSGKMLSISVLDHIIVSDEGYFSFANEGMI